MMKGWYNSKRSAIDEDAQRIQRAINHLDSEIRYMQMNLAVKQQYNGYPFMSAITENFNSTPKMLSNESFTNGQKFKATPKPIVKNDSLNKYPTRSAYNFRPKTTTSRTAPLKKADSKFMPKAQTTVPKKLNKQAANKAKLSSSSLSKAPAKNQRNNSTFMPMSVARAHQATYKQTVDNRANVRAGAAQYPPVTPTKTSATRLQLSRRTSTALKNNLYSPHVKVHLIQNKALLNSMAYRINLRKLLQPVTDVQAPKALVSSRPAPLPLNMLVQEPSRAVTPYKPPSKGIPYLRSRLWREKALFTTSCYKCFSAQYGTFMKRADRAKQNCTIFYGLKMHFSSQALFRRGWLQKLMPDQLYEFRNQSNNLLLIRALRGDQDSAAVLLSRMLENSPAYFVWQAENAPKWLFTQVSPYRNRIHRADIVNYKTKKGLIGCYERQHWWAGVEEAQMTCPRTYRLNKEDLPAFMEDFKQTQSISLLRYVCKHMDHPERLLNQRFKLYGLKYIKYALDVVEHMLRDAVYCKEASYPIGVAYRTPAIDLIVFQNACQKIVLKRAKLFGSKEELMRLQNTARNYLAVLYNQRPEYMNDGYNNIWLCKPFNSSCGHGIVLKNDIREIMPFKVKDYVVQKYIERPLLIYNTKFDIRQHALLSIGADTISLWLYDDCYLRFSSQQYSLDCLQESVHLTNNAVQKNYKNQVGRSVRLPTCNMWSLAEFQSYLHGINAPADTWPKIFDGFRQNILGVVLASLEEMTLTKNGFEIYGVDFMLDENYNPILIELNTTPDLRSTTPVTGALCPRVQEDMIRVIVDLPSDPKASTGGFVKLYEMPYENIAVDAKRDGALKVEGSAISMKDIPSTTSLSESIWSENLSEIE